MLKKESDTPSRINLGIRCSACVGFKKEAIFEKPCIKLGQRAKDFACPSFRPDIQRLTRIDLGALKTLAKLTKEMQREELQILAFTFRNMDFLKKVGMYFGQRVYFSMGSDYISEFVSGRVIGASANGEHVHISSDLGKQGNARLSLLRESVMTPREFKEHRSKLAKENRLRPPQRINSKPSLMDVLRMKRSEYRSYLRNLMNKPTDYEPPTLDTVPRSWLDKRQRADIGNIADSKRKKVEKEYKHIRVGKDGIITLRRSGTASEQEKSKKQLPTTLLPKKPKSLKPFRRAA